MVGKKMKNNSSVEAIDYLDMELNRTIEKLESKKKLTADEKEELYVAKLFSCRPKTKAAATGSGR
jgi:hypothetical protein